MALLDMTFIYLLQDPLNPTKGYIGKANQPRLRMQNHLTPKNLNKKNKIKLALQGRKQSPEQIEKRRVKMLGHSVSLSTRNKLSVIMKERGIQPPSRKGCTKNK
jgi:hypothetical protein